MYGIDSTHVRDEWPERMQEFTFVHAKLRQFLFLQTVYTFYAPNWISINWTFCSIYVGSKGKDAKNDTMPESHCVQNEVGKRGLWN